MEENFVESNAHFRPNEHICLKHASRPISSSAGLAGNETGCFDCNICLETAQDPVVTLCGHLYCWPCIYKWLNIQTISDSEPNCPVCKANISISSLVPLYGRGITPSELGPKHDNPDTNIPRRPCGSNTLFATSTLNPDGQFHLPHPPSFRYHGGYTTMASTDLGSAALTSFFNPIFGMFGEMVYARMFGTYTNVFPDPYPSGFSLIRASSSGHRMRRQEMQLDKSLNRVSVFLLCCIILCLVLF